MTSIRHLRNLGKTCGLRLVKGSKQDKKSALD
jgi:hypothetical protein